MGHALVDHAIDAVSAQVVEAGVEHVEHSGRWSSRLSETKPPYVRPSWLTSTSPLARRAAARPARPSIATVAGDERTSSPRTGRRGTPCRNGGRGTFRSSNARRTRSSETRLLGGRMARSATGRPLRVASRGCPPAGSRTGAPPLAGRRRRRSRRRGSGPRWRAGPRRRRLPGSSMLKRTSGRVTVPMNSWWKRTPGLGGEEPLALGDVREIGEEQLAALAQGARGTGRRTRTRCRRRRHWTPRRRPSTQSHPTPQLVEERTALAREAASDPGRGGVPEGAEREHLRRVDLHEAVPLLARSAPSSSPPAVRTPHPGRRRAGRAAAADRASR